MIVLQANQINKSYGVTPILSNISLQVHDNDKLGIVGPNGAGKSTFLKILAGVLSKDGGTVQIGKNVSLSYLAQNSGLESENTIWEEMLLVFAELHQLEQQLRQLEHTMGSNAGSEQQLQKTMEEYSLLQEKFERAGGYQTEANIRNILAGLGFSDIDYKHHAINQCSGGQKTRLALAKILLSKPAIILLDEPTNYLDIDALTWLEQFIKDFDGAMLVVSHDRYFLDAFVTAIYEIENTVGIKYQGGYTQYLTLKQQHLLEQEKQFQLQQEEIAKTEEFIQKNIARATTSNRAKSRRKQLEKIELLEAPQRQSETFFSFHAKKRSGNIVLNIKDLAASYAPDKTPLFSRINLHLERRDRVAIIGPNGTGKSTLLKVIAKRLQPTDGEIAYGSHVQIGYYDQEQEDLHPENTIFDEIHNEFPTMTKTEVRSALAQFLFTGDDVEKRISSLSGGEKARVTLTKLMLAEDNLLLLDEPTNHLDIAAKEVLEQALIDYDGTIIMISHDRYFLNRIATKIVYMTREQLHIYHGNYDYYLEKRSQLQQPAQTQDRTAVQKENHEQSKRRRNNERQLLRRYEQVETEIQKTEAGIASLEKELCNPAIFDNYEEIQRLQASLQEQQSLLDNLLTEWEQLALEKELIESENA